MPPCQNFPTGQPEKPGMYYQQKPYNFNKNVVCSQHCFLWHDHWALVYRGIPSDLRSRPEKSRHLPGLCFPDDYRQPIEFPTDVPAFNSTENTLIFTIYYYIFRLLEKVWYLTKSIPFGAAFIYLALSAECTGLIKQPTAGKGLRLSRNHSKKLSENWKPFYARCICWRWPVIR